MGYSFIENSLNFQDKLFFWTKKYLCCFNKKHSNRFRIPFLCDFIQHGTILRASTIQQPNTLDYLNYVVRIDTRLKIKFLPNI